MCSACLSIFGSTEKFGAAVSLLKVTLQRQERSKLISKEALFLALKENLPRLNKDQFESTKKPIGFV